MKKIHLPRTISQEPAEGAYGLYFRVAEDAGVKILMSDVEYPSRMSEIPGEYNMLQKLNKKVPGIWPKCFGLVKIFYMGHWVKGIHMEHVSGKQLSWYDLEEKNKQYKTFFSKKEKLISELSKKGIHFSDDHDENIFVTKKGEIRFIDADPGGVAINKKSKYNDGY